MRRIVVSMWTTLDGYAAGPQDEMDWLVVDDDMMAYETSLVTDAEALLLGRGTHGDFAGAWPSIARDDAEDPATRAYAQREDGMPKIVVTRSGNTVDWNNTSRMGTLDADAVAQLKDEGDGDIVVYGSLSVIATLQGLGAVDEYHVLVHPTAIGRGKPLFASPARLQLRSVVSFPSGVTLMRYTAAADEE